MSELELDAASMEVFTCVGLQAQDGAAGSLHGIDFSIPTPAIVGVLSPERSVTGLLLDLLTGFQQAKSGKTYLAGRRIDGQSPTAIARAGLVRTRSEAQIPPDATVEQLLAVALRFGRLRHNPSLRQGLAPVTAYVSREIRQAIERAELTVDLCEPIGSLTRAERLRLELARCLVQGPLMIAADQPFAGLSGGERAELARIFRSLHQIGVAVLVADHDTLTLSQLCERVLVLHKGRLIADGAPEDVGALPHVQVAFTGTDRL